MNSKIKIKLGPIEVEYEGSEEFLKEELPNFIKTVAELYKTSYKNLEITNKEEPIKKQKEAYKDDTHDIKLSTQSIASKLLCKQGPDLIVAASAKLTFVDKIESFDRKLILKEIKTATAYCKRSHLTNFKFYLNGLVKKGTLNELSSDKYALSAKIKKDVLNKIA